MPYIDAFRHFDPRSDEVSDDLPWALIDIARRARRFLKHRTLKELRLGAAMLHILVTRYEVAGLAAQFEHMEKHGLSDDFASTARGLLWGFHVLGMPECNDYAPLTQAELFALLAAATVGELVTLQKGRASGPTVGGGARAIPFEKDAPYLYWQTIDALDAVALAELFDVVLSGGRSESEVLEAVLAQHRKAKAAKAGRAKRPALARLKADVQRRALEVYGDLSARKAAVQLTRDFAHRFGGLLTTPDKHLTLEKWIGAARRTGKITPGPGAPGPQKIVIPPGFKPGYQPRKRSRKAPRPR